MEKTNFGRSTISLNPGSDEKMFARQQKEGKPSTCNEMNREPMIRAKTLMRKDRLAVVKRFSKNGNVFCNRLGSDR